MKCSTIPLLAMFVASVACAQQQAAPSHASTGGVASFSERVNLPEGKIGKDDLLGITVYDAPELNRTVRVDADGDIRLPMLRHHIHAAGLSPADLENAITTALIGEHVLVDPIVTVSVVEYRSRPITVAGAVKIPVTFQAIGNVTLLDAISRAGGLTENAGSEILVTRPASGMIGKSVTAIERISVLGLYSEEDSTLNLHLEGGEEVRVPEAGRVFVLGDVKKPGAFYITGGAESSVRKELALSGGLDSFPSHMAYIYRIERSGSGRSEIPIKLKKIMNRKSSDVPLFANDIFYVPNATGVRASLKILEASIGTGAIFGTALIYH